MASTGTSLGNQWLKYAPPPRPLGPGEAWNVFLSYRSVNRAWVMNLYDVLRQHGHKVFVDQCALRPGDNLMLRLQEALQSSQSGVLIWSKATGDSQWVANEYTVLNNLAMQKPAFQFVPITLDGSQPPLMVANRVYLDFKSYPDGPNGGDLLRLLHAVVGQPLSPEAAQFAAEQDEEAQVVGAKLAAAVHNGRAERLIELAKQGGVAWDTSPILGCKAAEGLTKLGKNDEAITLLDTVAKRFPHAVRPKQLRAGALARRGKGSDLDDAQEILGVLYESGERDSETLGIYARTWMDRYSKSQDPAELRRSRDLYDEAFERAPDDYYTGINAAAKSVFLGGLEDLQAADGYAAKVQQLVGTERTQGDYWKTATVGEVFLIRKDYANAARLYDAAVSMSPNEIGSHQTTWTQACRLMAKLQPSAEDRAKVRKPFGHLPDCP